VSLTLEGIECLRVVLVLKSELKTSELKRLLGAYRVIQRWHNKNKTGGNFGINIYFSKDDDIIKGMDKEITGEYNTDGVITSLHFGDLYQCTGRLPTEAYTGIKTLAEIILKRKHFEELERDKIHTSEQEAIGDKPIGI